jgi:flagellar motor switch protein FliG
MASLTMTGLEKVAVLLKKLPPEVVDKVMRHLDPRHAGMVWSQLAKLDEQDAQTDLTLKLAGVLDEAVQLLEKDLQTGKAAAPAAKTAGKSANAKTQPQGVDIRVDGKQEKAASVPDSSAAEVHDEPIAALESQPAELLAAALNNENPRTISLLMNRMEIEAAAKIYKRLTPAKRREVSLRFTDLTPVGDELIKRIAQGVLKKCAGLRATVSTSTNEEGVREKRMATLLRSLERTERQELIVVLEESDAELIGRVKALLYQFEDILRLENQSVQKLLSEVDVKSLALALQGAPKEIEEKILANLSKRAQESLKEEISLTGKVPAAKIKQARQTMLEALQRLDLRGELIMNE